MTIFPELTPATRTFTPGRHPHSEIPSMNGLQSRVRISNAIIDQRLQLTFAALTEAQMLSIHSHYIDRQGRFLSFAIPNSLLSGMLAPASFTPINGSWLYASSPQVEDVPGLNRYTVSVELINAPSENATASGCSLGITTALATNQVPGGTTSLTFDPPLEIDGGSNEIELLVTGVIGAVAKVEITISFTKLAWADDPDPFTYNNDIQFYLTSPDQTGYVALTYGFPAGQSGLTASAIITFGDDYSPYTASTLISGDYSPDEPLSYFNGETANGIWQFDYSDAFAADDPLLIHAVSITVSA